MDSTLERYRRASLLDSKSSLLHLSQLHTACDTLLRCLAPDVVAGGHSTCACRTAPLVVMIASLSWLASLAFNLISQAPACLGTMQAVPRC